MPMQKGQKKHRNDGLSKACPCARKNWTRCSHPWHFAYRWQGRSYRFSLNRHLQRRVESRTEAEAEAEQLRVAIRAGTFDTPTPEDAPASTMTVRAMADEYLRRYVAVKRAARARVFENAWRVITTTEVVHPTRGPLPFGDWPMTEVVADTVEQFREARLAAGTGVPGTNRYLGYVRATWAWAVRAGHASSTPFRRHGEVVVRLDKQAEQPRSRRLEHGEEERLLAVAAPHLHAVVVAALETGMRRGEILSLQWSQVRGLVPERRDDEWTLTWKSKPELFLPYTKTKTKRDRVIPISSRLRAVLEMRRLDPKGEPFPADAYVFGNAVGERVACFIRAWTTAVLRAHGHEPAYTKTAAFSPESKAEVRRIDLHFHDLRREAGSRWLDAGVPLHTVRDWLGHSNIAQTSTYLAGTTKTAHDAMARFEAAMGRDGGSKKFVNRDAESPPRTAVDGLAAGQEDAKSLGNSQTAH